MEEIVIPLKPDKNQASTFERFSKKLEYLHDILVSYIARVRNNPHHRVRSEKKCLVFLHYYRVTDYAVSVIPRIAVNQVARTAFAVEYGAKDYHKGETYPIEISINGFRLKKDYIHIRNYGNMDIDFNGIAGKHPEYAYITKRDGVWSLCLGYLTFEEITGQMLVHPADEEN